MSDDNHSGMLGEGAMPGHDSNDSQESLGGNDGGVENSGGADAGVEGVADTFNPGSLPPNRDIERESQAESPDIESAGGTEN
ncbi:MAG: hypothetical protein ACXU8U_03820 [Asticcacaulis sp.]